MTGAETAVPDDARRHVHGRDATGVQGLAYQPECTRPERPASRSTTLSLVMSSDATTSHGADEPEPVGPGL
ncbi:hypothetical protein ASE25_09420 [Terrabacter sp. Root85]|nr:hypothetical protein ASE25_09420 [Terrabacter sp. Root85]KRF47745.1 hypothetical protein ASH01_21320 [Terrabacter sp. Soil811]